MVLAVCIDDHNGLMFNKRRVSADRNVIEDIIHNMTGDTISIAPYSLPLFKDYEHRVAVTDAFLDHSNVFCFAEYGNFLDIIDTVQTLIVYKWNRKYPSDLKFPMDQYKSIMILKSVEEFEGHSHECITREVYVR